MNVDWISIGAHVLAWVGMGAWIVIGVETLRDLARSLRRKGSPM